MMKQKKPCFLKAFEKNDEHDGKNLLNGSTGSMAVTIAPYEPPTFGSFDAPDINVASSMMEEEPAPPMSLISEDSPNECSEDFSPSTEPAAATNAFTPFAPGFPAEPPAAAAAAAAGNGEAEGPPSKQNDSTCTPGSINKRRGPHKTQHKSRSSGSNSEEKRRMLRGAKSKSFRIRSSDEKKALHRSNSFRGSENNGPSSSQRAKSRNSGNSDERALPNRSASFDCIKSPGVSDERVLPNRSKSIQIDGSGNVLDDKRPPPPTSNPKRRARRSSITNADRTRQVMPAGRRNHGTSRRGVGGNRKRTTGLSLKDRESASAFLQKTRGELQEKSDKLAAEMKTVQDQLSLIDDLTIMGKAQKTRRLFNLIDADGDGTVDPVELADALNKRDDEDFEFMLQKSISLVAEYDEDGNAVLDFEEFSSFLEGFCESVGVEVDELLESFALDLLRYEGESKDKEDEKHCTKEEALVMVQEHKDFMKMIGSTGPAVFVDGID